MKQAKSLWAALGMALVLAGAGLADAKTTHHTLLSGKIVSVDAALHQITVSTGTKAKPHTVKVAVAAKTTVKLNKKHGSFSSLKVGDKVQVSPSAAHPTTITDLGHTHHKKLLKK